jgi:hypothetical protein
MVKAGLLFNQPITACKQYCLAAGATQGNIAYTQNVTGHAKRRQCNNKMTEKMKRQAKASAKSKELQLIAQANAIAAHLLLLHPSTTYYI